MQKVQWGMENQVDAIMSTWKCPPLQFSQISADTSGKVTHTKMFNLSSLRPA